MKKRGAKQNQNPLLSFSLQSWSTFFLLVSLLVPTSAQAQSTLQQNPTPIRIAQVVNSRKVTEANVKAALLELENLTNQLLKKTGVPGVAIAVVYNDQIVYLKGFGVREAGKPDLVDPDTVFQLASVSKPIASTVVAGIVGDGLVKWDDPIIKHMPDFQMDSPYTTSQVTIQDMFSHRSGLPEHVGDELEDLGFDRATILQRLRYISTGDRFRSVYNYTNFGLTAAAEAVAKATGKSWEILSSDRLYRPLGMNHTSSRYADFEKAENRALGHVPVNGKWVAKYKRQPDAEAPAGGASSTVRDLAQWMRLQLGNGMFEGRQIISAKALGETHIPYMLRQNPENPATDRGDFYGLGWNVGYTNDGLVLLGHSGAFNLGAATAVYLLPAEKLGIVVLTNARPIGVPESIALSFLDLARSGKTQNYFELFQPIFAAMDKPNYGTLVDYAKPPAQRLPALPANTYIGSYRNNYFGEIAIASRNGRLVLLQGATTQQAFPLQHYNRDTFAYQPEGENAFGLSGVTFTIGADGKATNVLIENLNILNQGTFQRVPPQK